jgi:hypothetical protein
MASASLYDSISVSLRSVAHIYGASELSSAKQNATEKRNSQMER